MTNDKDNFKFKLDGKIKQFFELNEVVKKRKTITIFMLILLIAFLTMAFNVPAIKYGQFCKNESFAKNVYDLKSMPETMKLVMCRANGDMEMKSVEFILYIFFMTMRLFFIYLASITLSYFFKKDISNDVLLGCCLLIWAISGLIYVSTYLGWF